MSAIGHPAAGRVPGIPWTTGAIAALALALRLWPEALSWLALDRERALGGEVWRLWTAHLVHFSGSHLGWNLAAFVPAGAWAERIAPRRTRVFYAVAPVAIGVTLLGFVPALRNYAGLSGVAAGALALLAFTQLRQPGRNDRWFWWSVLALVVVKIGLELVSRAPAFARFDAADIRPVPLAHLAGVACAAAVMFWPRARR